MSELISAFASGNAAILTNACMLPLYPGLIAFLAGTANDKQKPGSTAWLGVLVLAGILTMMTLIGFILYLLSASFGDALSLVLPPIYIIVIVLGVMMLMGRNPFAKLQTAQAPMLRNRYVTAYVYGLFFGPMTLPCTGPIIVSAFAIGATSTGALLDGLLFFFVFGLGFGWPLMVLPLLAMPIQRRIISFLGKHHDAFTRGSGILLIAIGIFGFVTELLPHSIPDFGIDLTGQLLFWAVALLLAVSVGYWTYRQNEAATASEKQAPAGA